MNSIEAFVHVPLGLLDSQPVLKVFSGCMRGFTNSGFFCQTATSILHVTKVGEPPLVMFKVAEGVKIVDIHAEFRPGAGEQGLHALIITSDNKIYSTGSNKTSLLEKGDASISGTRDDWADWVEPSSPLVQLNMAPMRLLPPGETLVSVIMGDTPGGKFLGDGSFWWNRIETLSPAGKKGMLVISTGQEGDRLGTWMFKRD